MAISEKKRRENEMKWMKAKKKFNQFTRKNENIYLNNLYSVQIYTVISMTALCSCLPPNIII